MVRNRAPEGENPRRESPRTRKSTTGATGRRVIPRGIKFPEDSPEKRHDGEDSQDSDTEFVKRPSTRGQTSIDGLKELVDISDDEEETAAVACPGTSSQQDEKASSTQDSQEVIPEGGVAAEPAPPANADIDAPSDGATTEINEPLDSAKIEQTGPSISVVSAAAIDATGVAAETTPPPEKKHKKKKKKHKKDKSKEKTKESPAKSTIDLLNKPASIVPVPEAAEERSHIAELPQPMDDSSSGQTLASEDSAGHPSGPSNGDASCPSVTSHLESEANIGDEQYARDEDFRDQKHTDCSSVPEKSQSAQGTKMVHGGAEENEKKRMNERQGTRAESHESIEKDHGKERSSRESKDDSGGNRRSGERHARDDRDRRGYHDDGNEERDAEDRRRDRDDSRSNRGERRSDRDDRRGDNRRKRDHDKREDPKSDEPKPQKVKILHAGAGTWLHADLEKIPPQATEQLETPKDAEPIAAYPPPEKPPDNSYFLAQHKSYETQPPLPDYEPSEQFDLLLGFGLGEEASTELDKLVVQKHLTEPLTDEMIVELAELGDDKVVALAKSFREADLSKIRNRMTFFKGRLKLVQMKGSEALQRVQKPAAETATQTTGDSSVSAQTYTYMAMQRLAQNAANATNSAPAEQQPPFPPSNPAASGTPAAAASYQNPQSYPNPYQDMSSLQGSYSAAPVAAAQQPHTNPAAYQTYYQQYYQQAAGGYSGGYGGSGGNTVPLGGGSGGYTSSYSTPAFHAPGVKTGPDMSKMNEILLRTGYHYEHNHVIRKYGPPPDWVGDPPGSGHELFVGKIPNDLWEDEIIPVFEQAGKIYEVKILIDKETNLNKGFCFVCMTTKDEAKAAIAKLNGYFIRSRHRIFVKYSVQFTRLFVGGIPRNKTREEIFSAFHDEVHSLADVEIMPGDDQMANRGFCFLDFKTYFDAAVARKRFQAGKITIRAWGRYSKFVVEWAVPLDNPDEEAKENSRTILVKGLSDFATEGEMYARFQGYGAINKVFKQHHYAFVEYMDRSSALAAIEGEKEKGGYECRIHTPIPEVSKRMVQAIRERTMEKDGMTSASGIEGRARMGYGSVGSAKTVITQPDPKATYDAYARGYYDAQYRVYYESQMAGSNPSQPNFPTTGYGSTAIPPGAATPAADASAQSTASSSNTNMPTPGVPLGVAAGPTTAAAAAPTTTDQNSHQQQQQTTTAAGTSVSAPPQPSQMQIPPPLYSSSNDTTKSSQVIATESKSKQAAEEQQDQSNLWWNF